MNKAQRFVAFINERLDKTNDDTAIICYAFVLSEFAQIFDNDLKMPPDAVYALYNNTYAELTLIDYTDKHGIYKDLKNNSLHTIPRTVTGDLVLPNNIYDNELALLDKWEDNLRRSLNVIEHTRNLIT